MNNAPIYIVVIAIYGKKTYIDNFSHARSNRKLKWKIPQVIELSRILVLYGIRTCPIKTITIIFMNKVKGFSQTTSIIVMSIIGDVEASNQVLIFKLVIFTS